MGKTGTSEIPLDGGYDESINIISCVLGFPYEDPEYMIYFAYVSPETVYYNYDIKPIPDLIDRIALLENIVIQDDANSEKYVFRYDMFNLHSKTITEAQQILNSCDLEAIIIGDGTKIVDQYPSAGSDIYTKQKVFLLTDGKNIGLPDFMGWTRKDIINYANMAGIDITIEGSGTAYEQSQSPGTIMENGNSVIIKLRDYAIEEEEPIEETEDEELDNDDDY